MSPLRIYKASAGSGKTYALTLQYLLMMFRPGGSHRNILAVTFTNKAAGEMKERILRRLNDLSRGDGEEDLATLMMETGLDETGVRRKARVLLSQILNDYSAFSVGTIDKFFQSVIRAFTREMGIQPAYNLELDHKRILGEGVDQLFMDLGDDPELLSWLTRYAEQRMEDAQSWNFRAAVEELGMQLFKESFQQLFTGMDLGILNRRQMEQLSQELDEQEASARKAIVALGDEALRALASRGLSMDDFSGKSRSPAALFSMAAEKGELNFTGPRMEAITHKEKWLKKGAPASLEHLTVESLMPGLGRIHGHQVVLNTVAAIRKNVYTLGILGDLNQRVQQRLRERNMFLIADSSRFLKGIIGANQVPFVYEKTGMRFQHILLDEFQDTSVFQYDNFRPLLDNSLANGHENLVVGDVKQSIYRWRNSDWKILASSLEIDFSHQEISIRPLGENYRSRENVIRFNNTVFQLAGRQLASRIQDELAGSVVQRREADEAVSQFRNAYKDAVQRLPEKKTNPGGQVRLRILPKEEDLSFQEQALEALPHWVDEILDSGVAAGEIAILTRSRKEGVQVAGRMLEWAEKSEDPSRYRLISSDSLLLSQNMAVSLLLSSMRYLLHPSDRINAALLKYRYHLVCREGASVEDRIFDASCSPEEVLPASFVSRLDELRHMPLFEMLENLVHVFGLDSHSRELPYVQAFLDLVLDLQRRDGISIPSFLQYWEQSGDARAIQVSENSNAIRILTVHRAKGLEFKAVIIPFCNWELTTGHHHSNLLWCRTDATPFKEIPVLPLRYAEGLKETLFASAYYQERMKGYLDSLNLMYVAFTRAVDQLYVSIPEAGEGEMKKMGDLLHSLFPLQADTEPCLGRLDAFLHEQEIHIGEAPAYKEVKKEEKDWVFSSYGSARMKALKLRIRQEKEEQRYGKLMHLAFSLIRGPEDISGAVEQLIRTGLLSPAERMEVLSRITEWVESPGGKPWFGLREGEEAYNERALITSWGANLRPDRVILKGQQARVVDFKFGEIEKRSYVEQMQTYMTALKNMGYSDVAGFLWYPRLGLTRKIELP